ncbi:MAG: hypothetical protein R3D81_12570 [Thalassovita sp.]
MIALFVALVGTVTRVMRRILRDEQATFLHEEQGALALPVTQRMCRGRGLIWHPPKTPTSRA